MGSLRGMCLNELLEIPWVGKNQRKFRIVMGDSEFFRHRL